MPNDHDDSLSDAELTAFLKNDKSDAALDELYRRHHSAVLSYARTCCRDPHTAEDLTSEAFARTLQAVRSGNGPEAAWRPYLLTIVRRTAADWAGTARRTELSPDFERWLANIPGAPDAESSEERMLRLEENSLVLRAFHSLPERWQTVLWLTVVEGEPADKVGTVLGMSTVGVNSLAARARQGLREAYLAAHVENGSATDECRHYSSLLGAVVRRTGRRRTKDFDRHLSQCEHCRKALIELTDLNERLGSVLPFAVLLWGGSAYVAARLTDTGLATGTGTLASGSPNGALHRSIGLWAKPGVAAAIATVVGVTIVLLPVPFSDHDESPQSAPPLPVTHKDTSPTTPWKPPPHLPPRAARTPSSPSTPTLSPPTAAVAPLSLPRRAVSSPPTPATPVKGAVAAKHSPTTKRAATPTHTPTSTPAVAPLSLPRRAVSSPPTPATPVKGAVAAKHSPTTKRAATPTHTPTSTPAVAPTPTRTPTPAPSPPPMPAPTPPPTPAPTPPPPPAATPTPPLTQPAAPPQTGSGSDLSACYHDTCQVEVTGGDTIPLDGQAGVDVLKIVSVADNSLSYQASSGNGAQTASGSQSSPGTSTVNQLVVDILCGDESRALIRLHKS
ncbi:sigma-70 family RNA polymerase sigma factor [Streptomyces sp. NPDC054933]